jgi:hypothetical protein
MGDEQLKRRLVWLPFALRTQPRIPDAPILGLRGTTLIEVVTNDRFAPQAAIRNQME